MATHYLDLFVLNAYGERDHKASPLKQTEKNKQTFCAQNQTEII